MLSCPDWPWDLSIVQASFEFTIFLHWPPNDWDERLTLPSLTWHHSLNNIYISLDVQVHVCLFKRQLLYKLYWRPNWCVRRNVCVKRYKFWLLVAGQLHPEFSLLAPVFWWFETGSPYVTLTFLKLTMKTRLALNSHISPASATQVVGLKIYNIMPGPTWSFQSLEWLLSRIHLSQLRRACSVCSGAKNAEGSTLFTTEAELNSRKGSGNWQCY